jgi:tetratricopeptide (TPR) repeat protein
MSTESNERLSLRISRTALPLLVSLLIATPASAQLITMSKVCREQVAQGNAMNDAGDHRRALELFSGIVAQCETKDGKEAVQVGIARAQNGLYNYPEAIAAANLALDVSKGTSLNALFERAIAEEKSGNMEAASADYDRIIALTEKNQNVRERATIYAKVADLNYRAGKIGEANSHLATAMQLDPDNADFYIQRGDWAADAGNYDRAFDDYDKAVAMGRTDPDMYAIRGEARIKTMQQKYGTENVQQLRAKMTPDETAMVCADVKKALDLGLKDMQIDMFAALVCR